MPRISHLVDAVPRTAHDAITDLLGSDPLGSKGIAKCATTAAASDETVRQMRTVAEGISLPPDAISRSAFDAACGLTGENLQELVESTTRAASAMSALGLASSATERLNLVEVHAQSISGIPQQAILDLQRASVAHLPTNLDVIAQACGGAVYDQATRMLAGYDISNLALGQGLDLARESLTAIRGHLEARARSILGAGFDALVFGTPGIRRAPPPKQAPAKAGLPSRVSDDTRKPGVPIKPVPSLVELDGLSRNIDRLACKLASDPRGNPLSSPMEIGTALLHNSEQIDLHYPDQDSLPRYISLSRRYIKQREMLVAPAGPTRSLSGDDCRWDGDLIESMRCDWDDLLAFLEFIEIRWA